MERIFAPALVACIAEGRSPHISEFEELVAAVLREAFVGVPTLAAKRCAELVADFAFHGARMFR
jgi:hypothetical protein